MRLCLDANAIIHGVEGPFARRASVLRWVREVARHDGGVILTSRLSTLECLIRPLRDANHALVQEYEGFFGRVQLVEIDKQVVRQAASLRAHLNVSTPDAIHLASAVISRADAFLTADKDLVRCKEVHVVVLGIQEPT